MSSRLQEILRTPIAYWQGLFYYQLKNWNAADACFDIAMEKAPDHAETLFKRGMIRYKHKNWTNAFPYIQKALFIQPDRTEWMAQFNLLEERLDGAIPKSFLGEDEIHQRIEALPDCVFLHSQLARCYRASNKWWLQVEALQKALLLEDHNAGLHFRHGEALEQMNRYGEAAAEYERAALLTDRFPLWFYKAGYAYSMSSGAGPKEHAKSLQFYEKAVAHPKNSKNRHLGVGAFHRKFGRWQLAAEAFEQLAIAWESDNRGSALFQLGFCHDRMYQWARAEHYYRIATTYPDCEPEWHYRLGFVLERQGQYHSAAEAYRAATGSGGKQVHAWFYRLGFSLTKAGDHKPACEAYRCSLPLEDAPACPDLTWIDELEIPARELDRVGYTRGILAQDLAADATNPDRWWKFGNCLEVKSQWEDAADAYQQAAMRTGKHVPKLYFRWACCLVALGRHDDACEIFSHLRPIRRPHGLNKSLFEGDPAFRAIAVYTEYYETLPIQPKTVLYESFHGKNLSCNPFALFLRLLEDPSRADWIHVWSVNDPSNVPERFRAMKNVIFINRGSDTYMRFLASAGLLINNVTFYTYFIRKEGQIYLNTWHGTPWKTLGKHVIGEPFIYGNMSRNFLQATHILSQNPHTSDVLVRSFDLEGLNHGTIVETGYPRIDLTLNATEDDKSRLRTRLGIDGSKKVVLYAPTWRGSHRSPESEIDEISKEIKALAETGCQLLFRGHTLSNANEVSCQVPEDISTNDLLAVIDILVTDYSSIWFDFLPTGNPILFYLKDLQQYSEQRGLYFGVEELPGHVSYHLADLVKSLRQQILDELPVHAGYHVAKAKYCPFEDGNACGRALDLIFSEQAPHTDDGKPSVMMFGGKLIQNGITSSLANLVEATDPTKLRLTLLVETGGLGSGEEDLRRFQRLAEATRILPRTGRTNLSHEEKWIQDMFREDGGILDYPEIRQIYERAFAREYRRLLGTTGFDAAVDFEGYNVFWTSILGCIPRGQVRHKAIYQHNDLMSEYRVRFPYLRQIFDLYRYFDRIVSVSKMTMELNRDSLSDCFGIPDSKFEYVENALNSEHVRTLANENIDADEEADLFGGEGPVFVTIGRLSIEKDHEKLIRAFSKVRKRHQSARLVIVGDGPLLKDLGKLLERTRLEAAVRLLGFRENPFPYLDKADCFVLSSNHEGQPMVLLEAMILAKPIVATDIPGSRGVIEGRSGHLVENSIDGLVQGMLGFIEGKVVATPVDMEKYCEAALDAFYTKACELHVAE